VIEDDRQVGHALRRLDHRIELLLVDRNRFEHEAPFRKHAQRCQYVRAQHPGGVGFVCDEMAHAHELRSPCQCVEGTCARGFIGERNPADDAGDESVLVGDVQILERLVIVIERLHQERVIDTGCPQFGQEVVGREITGETVAEQRWQRPLALGDPPKVLVGVDDAHVAPLELTRLMDANVAELVIRRLD